MLIFNITAQNTSWNFHDNQNENASLCNNLNIFQDQNGSSFSHGS